MKKLLFSIICLFIANFGFAQDTDSTKVKKTTKTKTTTTTTTTTVISEPVDSVKQAKPSKKIKEAKVKEEFTGKRNIIKTNLTAFLLSTIHVNYERVINKNITAQLGVYYTFFGDNTSGNNNGNGFPKFRGFGITPEVRLYPAGLAPTGFFIGVSPRLQRYTISDYGYNNGSGTSETTVTALGVGIIGGGQWLINDIVSLEVYGGPSANKVTSTNTSGNQNSIAAINAFGFRFGFTVGVAF